MRLLLSFFLMLALFFFEPHTAVGQKAFKPIKAALKNKKSDEALTLIATARQDSTLATQLSLYEHGLAAAMLKYEQENEKIYLRKSPDTASFFRALYTAYDYALTADSLASLRIFPPKAWERFKRTRQAQLVELFPNISAGAHYFSQHADWQQTSQFAELALTAPSRPFFQGVPLQRSSAQISHNCVLHFIANFKRKAYLQAERFAACALADKDQPAYLYELYVLIQAAQNDSTELHNALRQGLKLFPQRTFFATQLADFYFRRGQSDSVLAFTAELLQHDSLNANTYELRAVAYQQRQKPEATIAAAQRMLRCDSTAFCSYLYQGQAYLTLAQNIVLPTSIHHRDYHQRLQQAQKLYQQARIYTELFRKHTPSQSQIWAPMLYEIYLKLNLGKEFEEISKLIDK